MTRYGIARFVGSWVSASAYRLRIKEVLREQASVDFLDPRGVPIQRPYMSGAPTVKMIAHYDDYNENFEVDLWEAGKGFILDLSHHYWTSSSAKRSCQPSADLRRIVFWMSVTRYSARWITLCDGRQNRTIEATARNCK